MKVSSVGGRRYAMGITDDWTATSHVIFLTEKREIYQSILENIRRSESVIGNRLQNIRLEGDGENRSDVLKSLSKQEGIHLEYSPAYDSKRNGIYERIMQEIGLLSRKIFKTRVYKHNYGPNDCLTETGCATDYLLRDYLVIYRS